MDRGPMALFGAIVAVGLGPALWLGAQFGSATVTPVRPPAVIEANQDNKAPGGAGAATEEPARVAPKPKSQYVPLSATPSARASASATSEPTRPDDPDTDPTTTEPTPSAGPSTPPTEVTTEPTDPSTGDPGGDDPADPPPPAPDDPGDGSTV